MSACSGCKNKKSLSGDCHVMCLNPPDEVVYIGACGPGHPPLDQRGAPNFSSSEERQAFADKVATERTCVVRCLWPGCGGFPFRFDSGGIFACSNKMKEK